MAPLDREAAALDEVAFDEASAARQRRHNGALAVLVGESNPYGSDPRFALYPEPLASAGGRLCHSILGLTKKTYLAAFERRNLLVGPQWSVTAARDEAVRIVERARLQGGCRRIVLLGARVAAAFGVPYEPFARPRSEHARPGVDLLVLPHPSGRSRAWNAPAAVWRARSAVEDFVGATFASGRVNLR